MESGATIQVVFNTFQMLPALLLKARLCVAPPIASNSTAQVFYCCVCSMPIDSEDAVVSWVKIVKIQLSNFELEEMEELEGEACEQPARSLWPRMLRMRRGEKNIPNFLLVNETNS